MRRRERPWPVTGADGTPFPAKGSLWTGDGGNHVWRVAGVSPVVGANLIDYVTLAPTWPNTKTVSASMPLRDFRAWMRPVQPEGLLGPLFCHGRAA